MKWLPFLLSRIPKDRHSGWKNLIRYADGFVNSANLLPAERYSGYVSLFSSETRACLAKGERTNGATHDGIGSPTLQRYFDACAGAENLNRFIYVDLKTSLADDLLALTDKMTMATSLECRAPFMDHEMLELAASMPAHFKVNGFTLKYILKKAVQPWLPPEILTRKKRGFGAPIGAWLRKDLKALVEDALGEDQVRRRGLFHWPVVKDLIDKHHAQQGDYTDHLMALINLELWFRQFVDNPVVLHDSQPAYISR